MRHEAGFNCMKIWNSKSGDNMYFDFDDKFGILFEVHFRHIIYHFEPWGISSTIP